MKILMACSVFFILILLSGCDIISVVQKSDDIDLRQASGFDIEVEGKLQDATLFPLQVGMTWTYEMVYSKKDELPFADEFVMSIDEIQTMNGVNYFLVKNYFLPAASLAEDVRNSYEAEHMEDPMLLRYANDRVYVLVDGQEKLLYSFTEDIPTWTMAFYNGEIADSRRADRIELDNTNVAVGWDYPGFMGGPMFPTRAESSWGDIFVPGRGRVRIVSFFQAFGTVVWDLKKITVRKNN